jgi:ABC-type multidrug transport system ATPase subunit
VRIELKRVRKSFGGVRALDDISMTIGPGEIIAVLGANGAGKTTLLRALAGVVSPDHGEILFDGEEFHRGRMDLRRRFVFLPDFPFLFASMDVLRHIGMMLRLYKTMPDATEERVVEALRHLDLLPLAETPLVHLSRGQLYKTALAGLLAVQPEVWLLDEPFASGMDPLGIGYFKEQARAAAAAGRTVIYSTQILDVAERFSDRVALIHEGRMLLFESVGEMAVRLSAPEGVLEAAFQKLREGESL